MLYARIILPTFFWTHLIDKCRETLLRRHSRQSVIFIALSLRHLWHLLLEHLRHLLLEHLRHLLLEHLRHLLLEHLRHLVKALPWWLISAAKAAAHLRSLLTHLLLTHEGLERPHTGKLHTTATAAPVVRAFESRLP